jgi:hypothetical protein
LWRVAAVVVETLEVAVAQADSVLAPDLALQRERTTRLLLEVAVLAWRLVVALEEMTEVILCFPL